MIHRLALENFGPFRARVELPLADQGLVLVRGRNEVSEAADSNGSGKTSILHGLCWALFGEDLEGRRADAVACRFTEGACTAQVDLSDGLGEWSVLRARRPAKLLASGIPGVGENEDMAEVQKRIEQRLGFGVRTFKNAVVFGQGTFERFAQADQAEQMRMLDEIQGVDLREVLRRTKEWRGQLAEKLSATQHEDSLARDRASMAEVSVRDLQSARAGFDAVKKERLEALEARMSAAGALVKSAREDLRRAEGDAAALAEIGGEVEAEEALAERCRGLCRALDEAARNSVAARTTHLDLVGRLEALLEEGECPSCRQPVKSRRKAIQALFSKEIDALAGAALAASSSESKALDEAGLVATEHLAQTERVAKLTPAGQTAARYLALLEERCSERASRRRTEVEVAATRVLDAVARERGVEEEREWDGAAALEAAQGSLASARESSRAAAARVEKIQAAVALAEYWVEAFGDRGIRSMLVDGVADFINERLAAHLEQLACGEATVRMSAQTELKKGGARERISFATEWAWGGAGPSDGSGGQDRRRDLAVFAAVQDLAESRSARPFPLKVWDEPGDNLDARGQELFLRWVETEARRRGTGLLITHSEGIASQADPDRVWTIVLGRGGARVEIA